MVAGSGGGVRRGHQKKTNGDYHLGAFSGAARIIVLIFDPAA